MALARTVNLTHEGIEGIFVKSADIARDRLADDNLISISMPIAIPAISFVHIQSIMEVAEADTITIRKDSDGNFNFVAVKDGVETALYTANNKHQVEDASEEAAASASAD